MIMKLFRMIKTGVRDAFKSVIRNFSLSLASISCISITLMVVSLALLVAFNVENFSKKAGDNVTIVTYLKYVIYLNGEKDNSNNPDINDYNDMITMKIHHVKAITSKIQEKI